MRSNSEFEKKIVYSNRLKIEKYLLFVYPIFSLFLEVELLFPLSDDNKIWQAPPKVARSGPAGFASCRVYSHKPRAP
jgi:hypothetical protein